MAEVRAYSLLRELVRDCGATLVEEKVVGKDSSHLHAEYEGAAKVRFRLCWDRREKRGVIQVRGPDKEWQDSGPEVRKTKSVPYTNLHAFMAHAEALAGRRAPM